MPFYLGLSLLSNRSPGQNSEPGNSEEPGRLSTALSIEARRILGLLSNREVKEASLVRETGGRPYFTDRGGDFSISHSKRAAAVTLIGGGYRTGCDIQYMSPRRDFRGISGRFFHPPEQDHIADGGSDEEMGRRFYALWTLKESFLKLRGLSIAEISGTPVFFPDTPAQDPAGRTAVNFPIFFLGELEGNGGERYMAAAALEGWPAGGGEFPQPVLRWFSEETLRLINIAEIKAELSPAKTVKPKT
jgi:hypothetical protein